MTIIKNILIKISDIIQENISEENSDFWISLIRYRERIVNYTINIKTPNFVPQRGEIYNVDLGINIGSELQKTRPCLVISNYSFNKGDTISIIPITTLKDYKKIGIISPTISKNDKNNLDNDSIILIAKIREISKKRIQSKRGEIGGQEMEDVVKGINVYLGLQKIPQEIDSKEIIG